MLKPSEAASINKHIEKSVEKLFEHALSAFPPSNRDTDDEISARYLYIVQIAQQYISAKKKAHEERSIQLGSRPDHRRTPFEPGPEVMFYNGVHVLGLMKVNRGTPFIKKQLLLDYLADECEWSQEDVDALVAACERTPAAHLLRYSLNATAQEEIPKRRKR